MAIEAKVERITPKRAKQLLMTNTNNRTQRADHVRHLVHALRNGEWMTNGETIKITDDGQLLDGQHRLQAIVAADMPAHCVVVYGVQQEAVRTIDLGRARTAGDALRMEGFTNPTAMAASLRWLINFVETRRWNRGNKASVIEIVDYAIEHYDENTERMTTIYGRLTGFRHRAMLAAMYVAFAHANPEKAERFYEQLTRGVDLYDGHPVLALRNRLIAERLQKSTPLTEEATAAIVIRAWNAVCCNRKVGYLKAKVDKFPHIHGLDLDAFLAEYAWAEAA